MTTHTPSINEILTTFFAARVELATGIARRRIEHVERRLRDCCEADGERVLETDDLAIVAVEREFDPVAVITRTMHAPDLLFILTLFVKPPWLFDDRLARRAQLKLSSELTRFLVAHRLVDYADYVCPILDIGASVRDGLFALRQTAR